VKRDELPGYSLSLGEAVTSREPLLRMIRREAAKQLETKPAPNAPRPAPKSSETCQRSASSQTQQADEPHNYLTDETLDYLRKHYRGWDFHALHQDFRSWLREDPGRIPSRYQSAFIGFVKQYHEKNRFQL
jgi:hypothetical protein